jgi:hypothetical protein
LLGFETNICEGSSGLRPTVFHYVSFPILSGLWSLKHRTSKITIKTGLGKPSLDHPNLAIA